MYNLTKIEAVCLSACLHALNILTPPDGPDKGCHLLRVNNTSRGGAYSPTTALKIIKLCHIYAHILMNMAILDK